MDYDFSKIFGKTKEECIDQQIDLLNLAFSCKNHMFHSFYTKNSLRISLKSLIKCHRINVLIVILPVLLLDNNNDFFKNFISILNQIACIIDRKILCAIKMEKKESPGHDWTTTPHLTKLINANDNSNINIHEFDIIKNYYLDEDEISYLRTQLTDINQLFKIAHTSDKTSDNFKQEFIQYLQNDQRNIKSVESSDDVVKYFLNSIHTMSNILENPLFDESHLNILDIKKQQMTIPMNNLTLLITHFHKNASERYKKKNGSKNDQSKQSATVSTTINSEHITQCDQSNAVCM